MFTRRRTYSAVISDGLPKAFDHLLIKVTVTVKALWGARRDFATLIKRCMAAGKIAAIAEYRLCVILIDVRHGQKDARKAMAEIGLATSISSSR